MFYIVRDDLNIFYKSNSAAPGNLIFCKSAWVANMDMHHTRSVFSLGIMLPSQYTGTCVGSGGSFLQHKDSCCFKYCLLGNTKSVQFVPFILTIHSII